MTRIGIVEILLSELLDALMIVLKTRTVSSYTIVPNKNPHNRDVNPPRHPLAQK